jgi:glycosyltransferase involved in cell wall biosynthesis
VNHVATKHNARKRWVFSRIGWVTAVSEQVRATIHGPRDATVIYNGIEPRVVDPQPKRDRFTIVAVGRLDRYKGFDLLLREVATLPFDFVLEIVGEGAERRRLETLVRESRLMGKVERLGHREDVPELLAGAHMQVVSSLTEGFSLALLEGLLYADLVLSTPVGIAPEILPPELLFDGSGMAEKIRGVHEHYGEAIRSFAAVKAAHRDRFRLSHTVERYLELYGRVLAAR